MTTQVLLVAKAPVPGRVKTRLGAVIGMDVAAELAAAALLDTVRTCAAAVGPGSCRLALEGDLPSARYGDRLVAALEGWTVFPQRGDGLGERLAHAHDAVAGGGPVVQIGMDTPQLTTEHLERLVGALTEDDADAVLADAEDGGWWALGLADPGHGRRLVDVPMSTPTTATATRRTFEGAGLRVGRGVVLRDVDTVADAEAVAVLCPAGSEFARAWDRVS